MNEHEPQVATLTEFLLARIAERDMPAMWGYWQGFAVRYGTEGYRREQAANYTNHPDYREEWDA